MVQLGGNLKVNKREEEKKGSAPILLHIFSVGFCNIDEDCLPISECKGAVLEDFEELAQRTLCGINLDTVKKLKCYIYCSFQPLFYAG